MQNNFTIWYHGLVNIHIKIEFGTCFEDVLSGFHETTHGADLGFESNFPAEDKETAGWGRVGKSRGRGMRCCRGLRGQIFGSILSRRDWVAGGRRPGEQSVTLPDLEEDR